MPAAAGSAVRVTYPTLIPTMHVSSSVSDLLYVSSRSSRWSSVPGAFAAVVEVRQRLLHRAVPALDQPVRVHQQVVVRGELHLALLVPRLGHRAQQQTAYRGSGAASEPRTSTGGR